MTGDPLDPFLYMLLLQIHVPAVTPDLFSFYLIAWWAMTCSTAFHPWPAGFNHVEVWRVTTPKEPGYLM